MQARDQKIRDVRRQIIYVKTPICLALWFAIALCWTFLYDNAQPAVISTKSDDALNYKIGVGDVLKVLVLKQETLSQDGVRVGNEGNIRLPMLDTPISAVCLSETELSLEITRRYKKYILNPQVYVTVREFNAYPISVIGAVNSSGRFQMQRPMRLLDVLTRVNGPAVNAGRLVQVFRDNGTKQCVQNPENSGENLQNTTELQPEIISVSLPDLLKGSESANIYMQSGDIVRVTEADEVKVKQAYVIGNVKSATIVNLKEPVTLSRAIAMAGGFAPGAQTDKITISRQAPDSLEKTEIPVNLKDTKKRNQEDILLLPNDVVDVPGPKRSLLKDILKVIVPTVVRGSVTPF
jgi:polysaccharide biosynthesis/export protein